MPEYKELKSMKYPIIQIGFLNKEDKKHFLKKLNIEISDHVRYIHYPNKIVHKLLNYEYKITYKINPKFPVYIISKGRWKSRHTSKSLEKMGVPYKIIVEPQEYEKYLEVIDSKKILILPKKYLGLNRGGIPARNFVWEHAVKSGAKKHWILDDNIHNFYRWNLNRKWVINSGVLFRLIEIYVSRFTRIMESGMQYSMFYPARQTKYPVSYNKRIFSCILIDHKLDDILKERWRGKYNEDVDLSLRILKKGYATCLFNAFLCGKAATLSVKGGNTDTIYKSKQQIRDKAESLVKQHPDVARIVERYKRGVHHEVNYNKWLKNNLGVKSSTIGKNGKKKEYNMKLVKIS